jgi:hypothetical protein
MNHKGENYLLALTMSIWNKTWAVRMVARKKFSGTGGPLTSAWILPDELILKQLRNLLISAQDACS